MDYNKPIGQQLSSSYNLTNAQEGIKNFSSSLRENINSSVKDFSSKDVSTLGSEFMSSNTIVAKFVFLILVLIVFMILFNLGIYIITWFSVPSKDPYVVKGLINGNSFKVIPQDPKESNAVPIHRSNNENKGIEFTWSVWLRRNQTKEINTHKSYQHIFTKGAGDAIENAKDSTSTTTYQGRTDKGNGPGVYFFNDVAGSLATSGPGSLATSGPGNVDKREYNKIHIFMDLETTTADSYDNNHSSDNSVLIPTTSKIEIEDLPIGKWFHLAIRVENKIMDVYVNGTLSKRTLLEAFPKQNYDDIKVCGNGGFDGNLSDLRYFDNGLNVFQIMNITQKGPNMTSNDKKMDSYDYLSNSWYMN